VINFHNEAENVDMAPLALSRQSYRNFEVILVDDGSTDETAELIVRKYGSLLPCTELIRIEKNIGLRPARNLGVKRARGNVILTLDIHTTFDRLFIERIVTIFRDEKKVGVVGSVILPYGDKWFDCGTRVIEKIFVKMRRVKRYNYARGGAAAYNRSALVEIGYLSTGNIVEDTDASWKLANCGWNVLIAEDNLVFHKGDYNSFRGFLRKLFLGGIRAAFLLSKHRRKLIYPQNLLRVLLLPVVFLLSYFYPLLFLITLLSCCLLFALVLLVVFRQNIKESVFGTCTLLINIVVSSLGILYGTLANIVKGNTKVY
jgi:cellulose synthase/poly-beta-1,6-N-acetylglucosamine synthase-like glycosyltransferase